MAIETRCTGCNAILSIDAQHVGRRARCPTCGTEYTIPKATDQEGLDAVCHYCGEVLTVSELRREQGEYKTCDECLTSIDENNDAIEDERIRIDVAKGNFIRFCLCLLGLFVLYLILSVIYEQI